LDGQWRKSRGSESNGACIEVRYVHGTIQVRDSKNPNGPVLDFTSDQWAAFVGSVVDGELKP
jgi:hypothetical protein